jgi:hypothetical protein
MASLLNCVSKDIAGRAAGNYRLAACAPQKQCPRTLRHDKNLIGPRILYFAAGGVTAHIDISLIGVKGTEHVPWFARNCLGSRKLRLWGRNFSLGR